MQAETRGKRQETRDSLHGQHPILHGLHGLDSCACLPKAKAGYSVLFSQFSAAGWIVGRGAAAQCPVVPGAGSGGYGDAPGAPRCLELRTKPSLSADIGMKSSDTPFSQSQ
jgi:hypothetical protein